MARISLHLNVLPPESEKARTFRIARFFTQNIFRIKRVNRNTFAFTTKVLKTREFHVFLANMHNVESELFGDFPEYPESFYTIRTVFLIIQKVSKLSEQSLERPDFLENTCTVL